MAEVIIVFCAISAAIPGALASCCSPTYTYCSYGGSWNVVALAGCTLSATQTWAFDSATSVYKQAVGSGEECFDLCNYSLFVGASALHAIACIGFRELTDSF